MGTAGGGQGEETGLWELLVGLKGGDNGKLRVNYQGLGTGKEGKSKTPGHWMSRVDVVREQKEEQVCSRKSVQFGTLTSGGLGTDSRAICGHLESTLRPSL